MSQHAGLSAERWRDFTLDQQILMIGNEMNRTTRLLRPEDRDGRERGYERVLRLVDLTVEVQPHPPLRRELLRWRGLVAELFLGPDPDPAAHTSAFRALLLMTPRAAEQIPHLLG